MTTISRRRFMSLGIMAAGGQALLDPLSASAQSKPKGPLRPYIYTGTGPGRGDPPPHKLVRGGSGQGPPHAGNLAARNHW